MAKKVAIENICSFIFLCMFYNVFIKVKKRVFLMFFIRRSMFLTSMAVSRQKIFRIFGVK